MLNNWASFGCGYEKKKKSGDKSPHSKVDAFFVFSDVALVVSVIRAYSLLKSME